MKFWLEDAALLVDDLEAKRVRVTAPDDPPVDLVAGRRWSGCPDPVELRANSPSASSRSGQEDVVGIEDDHEVTARSPERSVLRRRLASVLFP